MKFSSKIKILIKKNEIFVKNINFDQKNEIFVKHQNFRQKYKFW